MSSEKKTISIDPTLFASGEKDKTKFKKSSHQTLKRERILKTRKEKPNVPKINTLRKNLLAKIKEHQNKERKEQLDNKKKELSENKSNTNFNTNEFDDEFQKSLSYLSTLAKNQHEQKHIRKKDKKRNRLTLKTSNFVNTKPIHNNPEIKLEMPTELQSQPVEINVVPTQSLSNEVPVSIPKQSNSNITPINSIKNLSETNSKVNYINNNNNPQPITALSKDVPYGVLRGGNKPTYREYIRTQSNQTQKKAESQHSKERLEIQDYKKPNLVSAREQLLNELKTQRQTQSKPIISIPAKKEGKKMKTMKRTITTRKFKLGRDAKKRVISVLIKNNHTRRKVKLELGQLSMIPLKDIRHYLKKNGLLKVGSSAPPDVLRTLYEQSILAGEVNNTSKDTLIHNFFNDKENW